MTCSGPPDWLHRQLAGHDCECGTGILRGITVLYHPMIQKEAVNMSGRPMVRRSTGVLFALVLLTAGVVMFLGQDQRMAGPCVHQTEGPVLAITEVRDAETGDQLSSFSVHNITKPGGHSVRSPVTCTGSCGFGRRDGNWTFTVHADGYEPEPVTVSAEYHTFEGGCPSFAKNGTEISVSLEPELL